MSEISKIKPTDVKPKEKPKFTYDDSAYRSFIKEGFEAPRRAPDRKEKDFLSRVDLTHGKIRVRITYMIRQMAVDYSSEREEKKEYLVWASDWYAKNWLGADIPPVRGHIEGRHLQQTKRLVVSTDVKVDGSIEAVYQRGAPRMIHTIPFSKKEVDKVLFGEHPCDADSINITNPDNVVYYGKFEGIRGVSGFRCNDYTYEQFVTPGWEQFLELAIRSGGPASRKPIVPDKPRFIT